MKMVETILFLIIILSLIASAYYSIRYRTQREPKKRGLYTAKMNIYLGIMLIGISIIQTFSFSDSLIFIMSGSFLRTIISVVFFLLGLFNLYSGARNHAYFKRKGA